jgi:hypothetical protein
MGGLLLRGAQAAVDPRGPIDNVGMTVVADSDGVQAPGFVFADDCKKPSPWQGKWIWLSGTGGHPLAGCFRKEVMLDQEPTRVTGWISADTKYLLYVNGRLVSRGPADIGRDFAGGSTDRWFYDCRNLTGFFHTGKNVVAAEVFTRTLFDRAVSRGHPGFLFEAEAQMPDQKSVTIASGPDWRGAPAEFFSMSQVPGANKKAAPVFTCDESKQPPEWRLADFDDSHWAACALAGDYWNELIPSEIPPLMEARYPVMAIDGVKGGIQASDGPFHAGQKIPVNADGSFTVVFNRALSAFPTLKMNGGDGAILTISAHHTVNVALGSGEQYFEYPFMDEVAPSFRVDVSHVTSPFEIADVGAVFTSQPVQYRGDFSCSDEQLNRIWETARWAVQICLQTHHLDSPNHQEPISDPGDYVIEAMVNNYAFAQPALTRQDIRKYAWLLRNEHYHNFHTSYSISWLQMLMDYYDYTGDQSLVVEMAPYVHELLDTYESWIGKNGIISEAPNYMFMDWVNIGGFACHHPPAVIGQGYMTAFYYHGLDMGRRVAELAGDSARAAKYESERTALAAAFNRELWDAGKGLYRDGKPFQTSVKPGPWLPADKPIETFSPHVNLLAVLFDLAPKEQQAEIVEKVLAEKPLNTQPWFMHWGFAAIDHAGLFDRFGVEQMHRWTILEPTQSFLEMWNRGDSSHGWCSTPLVQMSEHILGVAPAAPGFKNISIRPELCDLQWARGTVPTPLGDVHVEWSRTANGLTLDVEIPAGADAKVAVPVKEFKSFSVQADGKSIPTTGQGAPPIEVTVGAGKHHFLVSSN